MPKRMRVSVDDGRNPAAKQLASSSGSSMTKDRERIRDKDFKLGDIPDLKGPIHSFSPTDQEPPEPENRKAGEMIRELDKRISTWVEKYVLEDMEEIEKNLSLEQKEGILTSLKGYCAPLSWKTFTSQLPEAVYWDLPIMLAHAMISKNLHENVLCNPFYYLDDAYIDEQPLPLWFKYPPAGFPVFLNYLFREMIYARRDEALKCRKLMLRCLHGKKWRKSNYEFNDMYHTRYRKVAQKTLADRLLDDPNLRLLLKNGAPTDSERQDATLLYSMADELCIGMNLTTKDMQFRYWRTLPLYDSDSRFMELAPTSQAAEEERIRKEDQGYTKRIRKRIVPVLERRFVIMILRPAFSYLTADTEQQATPPREEDESIVCKASVVLTKTQVPLEGGVFSNLPTEIRDELEKKLSLFREYYEPNGWPDLSPIRDLGTRSEIPGNGPVHPLDTLI